MQFNKKVSLFTAAFLVLPVTAAFVIDAPATAAANPYSDVTTKDGHYEAIVNLTEQGIVSGVTKTVFHSTKAATRGEAALFIANALNLNTTSVSNPNFKDLPTSSPYYSAAAALYELKVIGGYTDGTFRPDGTLKRSEIAKMLTLAFELDMSSVSQTKFADVNVITDTNMKRYIQTLIDYGITSGTTATTFSPYGTLTRGQLATFLQRSMNAVSDDLTVISVE
ncbi:MAG: S-layer homology domain-containing protein [Solibacillus sp.]|uniref:S-layer homology domain-containing protein n=1 Tax=unclassified Solibacillus TaxID=2637870 RepID=UPI0031018D2E